MNLRPKQGLAAAIALMSAACTQAQTTPPASPPTAVTRGAAAVVASRPDPLDATAPVRAVVHHSALATFRGGTSDASVGSWKDVNDTVNRIGGWRAYAREAAAATDAPASSTPVAPTPAAPVSPPAASSPSAAGTSGAAPKPRDHHHHEGHGDRAVPRRP
jgi:hypothetical protein